MNARARLAAAAKEAGAQGTPILHAVISIDVDPRLARSAVEAVSKWRHRPTLLNGLPIEGDITIMVNYTLAS